MGAAWLKEGGLFILIFVSKGGGIGEGIKRERDKYRNYSTSIPSSPFPNMMQEREQLQGLEHGFQGQCIVCYVHGNME
jgi:hypothetical protein